MNIEPNLNSPLEVYFRESGSSIFQDAAIGVGAHAGLIIVGGSLGMNFYAASIMFLKPDTEYDIEVILDDPDGLSGMTSDMLLSQNYLPVRF